MIVHVFNSSIVSGPETLVIPALKRLGEPVTVVFLAETRKGEASERPVRYAKELGLETRVVEVRSRFDRKAIVELARVLAELAPRVVHSHDVKASTYLLRAAGPRSRRPFPIVSTHHGVRGRSGIVSKVYERFYARAVLPAFDRVLTVCGSDRALLVGRGLDPERVQVHLNGVDRVRVSPEERAPRRERLHEAWNLRGRGVSPDAVVLGFAGRIAGEKRLDRVLNVARHLAAMAAVPEWHLVIFGTGPLETAFHAMTRELGLQDRVHWMGYRSGLGEEMAGFDVLLSLSDAEGLPINLVEAGWAGTAVLATGVDGNKDLFPTRAHGRLVQVEDTDESIAAALAELVRDAEIRGSMGLQFQERVAQEFSGQRWVDQLRSVYGQFQKPSPHGMMAKPQ